MKQISVLPPRSILILAFSLPVFGLLSTAPPALGAPAATGACCFADGSCVILTQPNCAEQGGVWMGEDFSCDPNPCPGCLVPCFSGACCLPDGRCEWVTETICQLDNGGFQGGGTLCQPNPCGTAAAPDPTGKETRATWGKIKTIYR